MKTQLFIFSGSGGAMKRWQKRYYAHKRLYKANCGHKSFKKQKTPSVDIFDRKVDLNPPPTKFSDAFLCTLYRMPLSGLPASRGQSKAFFIARSCDKKDLNGTWTLLATKFLRLELCRLHIQINPNWEPVNCFSHYVRGSLQALFWYNISIACNRYHDETHKLCLFLL